MLEKATKTVLSKIERYIDTEQLLQEKWRSLPPDKQQEALDFVEFFGLKKATATKQPNQSPSHY